MNVFKMLFIKFTTSRTIWVADSTKKSIFYKR